MNGQRKKIAIVVQGFEYGGGVPAMAKFLYHTIAQSGKYEPAIISLAMAANDKDSIRLSSPTTWWQGIQQKQKNYNGFTITHLGAFLPEFEFQRYAPRAALTKLLTKFDLIQVVAGAAPIAYAVRNVKKPLCIFVATTTSQDRQSQLDESYGISKHYRKLMVKVGTWLEQTSLPYMSHIFCESDYTKALLPDLVAPSKLSLGVPGVDTDLFRPCAQYQDQSYILAVGRFADPRKNVKLLLQAYQQLQSSLIQTPKLVIAGHNGLGQEGWKMAEELGIAPHLETHQNLTIEELADLYRRASLFVLSSDEEGLGIVILEAMASGLPVISTDCGGPRSAVVDGQTGFLTPVGDASSLAAKIQLLLENAPLRRQMGRNGRIVAEKRFSMEAAGSVYLHKYDELLGQPQL